VILGDMKQNSDRSDLFVEMN